MTTRRMPAPHPAAANEQNPATLLKGVVVICTKDRPEPLTAACLSVYRATPAHQILVVDASSSSAIATICRGLASRHPDLNVMYCRADRPGLTHQRNQAVLICRRLGAEIVHFIDDDTEVAPDYFAAIERRFHRDPDVMGVGGVIMNQPTTPYLAPRKLFLLASSRPSAVLRSGRNTLGQYPNSTEYGPVDWLNGCSMSYRIHAFDELAFDSGREGYALLEDVDFSFRLSRTHRLAVEPQAKCVHHLSPILRYSAYTRARETTRVIHMWVTRNRGLGLSPFAFWWSVVGDFVLRAGFGLLRRDRETLDEARGVVSAVVEIVRGVRAG